MILIIASLFGISCFLVFWYVSNAMMEKRMVERRIRLIRKSSAPSVAKDDIIQVNFKKQSRRSRAASKTRSNKAIILYLLCFGAGYFLLNKLNIPVAKVAVLVIVVPILVIRITHIMVKRARLDEIERELPGALDLMVICLEAGLGINAALLRVANEMESGHLGKELRRTSDEVSAGIPLEDALRNFAKRTETDDINTIVTAIVQAQQMGTALALTFRVQAESLREKYKMRLKEKIHRVPVKIIFPLVFFIFPTLFVVILGPSLIHIMKTLSRT